MFGPENVGVPPAKRQYSENSQNRKSPFAPRKSGLVLKILMFRVDIGMRASKSGGTLNSECLITSQESHQFVKVSKNSPKVLILAKSPT